MSVAPNALTGAVDDPAERVATALEAKREFLLGVHRHRLGREDLEDCLGQAALELVSRARSKPFLNDGHIANALEQKFLSRITDRQRALAGRSAMAAATRDAVRLDAEDALELDVPGGGSDSLELDAPGGGSDLAQTVADRDHLRRVREVAAELSDDQRLVLACQVSLGMESAEFCEQFGWSPEKFKKVAQRARTRLTKLMAEYELGERCRRLDGDLLAYAANVASAAQDATVRAHLANCAGCAAYIRDLRLASGRVAAVLPIPALAAQAAAVKVGIAAKLHGLWRAITAPGGTAGGAAGAGPVGVGGLAKAGAATLCAVGIALGGHVVVAAPNAADRSTGQAARAPASQRAPAAPSALAVSDVLRPTHRPARRAPVSQSAAKRPTTRRHRPTRHSTAVQAVPRPSVAAPAPATAPPEPSLSAPTRAMPSRARSTASPPSPAAAAPSHEFGVE